MRSLLGSLKVLVLCALHHYTAEVEVLLGYSEILQKQREGKNKTHSQHEPKLTHSWKRSKGREKGRKKKEEEEEDEEENNNNKTKLNDKTNMIVPIT